MRRWWWLEIALAEMAVYLLLWIWDEYIASLFSLVFGAIFLFLLLISLVVEWIEPSKVPRWYYAFMLVSVAAPVAATLIYIGIFGRPEWLVQ